MIKRFFLASLLLWGGLSLSAQRTNETVYLKNGSVIHGEIVEQVPGKSLTIKTRDGNTFVYDVNEVERITKERAEERHGHRGLDFSVEGGLLANKGGASGYGAIEAGKRFNEYFYWGLGAGVGNGSGDGVAIPVFTTFKAYFPTSSGKIEPNLAFQVGTAFNTDSYEDLVSGLDVSFMPGFTIPIGQKVDFNFNAGYNCGINFRGGAVGHSFKALIGFSFHQPWDKSLMKIVPTRDSGIQYTLEGGAGIGGNSLKRYGGGIVLSYKWNPNISFGVGYNFSRLTETELNVTELLEINYSSFSVFGGDATSVHSVFLRGQYRLWDKKFSPFGSLDVGIRRYTYDEFIRGAGASDHSSFEIQSTKGSILLTPAIGGSLRTTNNSYFEFKLGYNLASRGFENEHGDKIRKGIGDFFLSVGYTHTLKWGSNWRK